MKRKKSFYLLAMLVAMFVFLNGCHRGPWMTNMALDHLDDAAEDLKLTEEQNVKYQEVRAKLEADMLQHTENRKEFKLALQEKASLGNQDIKPVTNLLREKLKTLPNIASGYLDHADELFEILDDQQKAQVFEKAKKKHARKRCHHRRHSGRILEHIDDEVDDLDLSEEQNQKYRFLKLRLEAEMAKQKADWTAFKVKMHQEAHQNKLEVKLMTSMLREKLNQMPPSISVYLDFIDEFFEILNNEQKAEVFEELKDKLDGHWWS